MSPDGGIEVAAANIAVPASKAMNFRQKFGYIVSNVTVEPTVILFLVPRIFTTLASQNLALEKACRVNLAYPDDVCTALTARDTTGFEEEEVAVQQLVVSVQTWKTPLLSWLPVIMSLFLGAWGDRTGRRKPCMLLPIIGELLSNVSLFICTYWFYEIPLEATAVLEAIWPALCGGTITFFVGIFSYVIDITTAESRMVRIGAVNVLVSAGLPMGMSLSGVLYVQFGFYGVFGSAAACYTLSIVYCLIRVKEAPRPPAVKQEKERSRFDTFVAVFSFRNISDTLKVIFTNGGTDRKIKLILLMIVYMVLVGPTYGEGAMTYLFSRYQFNWNSIQFSVFSTYNMLANLAGMAASIGLFSHMWKIDDALVGFISCMSKILASFVYGFANVEWMMYLAPVVESVNGAAQTGMRAIASKLVLKDELGKVNSLFGICESLMPLAYVPMYTSIYAATITTLPGSFFLLGGALTIPAAVIFIWFYIDHRRSKAQPAAEKADNESIELNERLEASNVNRVGLDNAAFETERAA